MKLVVTLAALMLPALVSAGDVTLSWDTADRKSTLTDAGPYSDHAGTKIYMLVAEVDNPNVESVVIPDQKPDTYTYVAVSYDDDGVHSPVTVETVKEVTEFVTTSATVFYPVAQPNGVLMLGIGTVPLGTPCNPNVEVNGNYAVDRALVDWAGTAEPLLVVAQCG